MMVLVTYDVSTLDKAGAQRLRRIAKTCQNYGQRVQFSVFEIEVDAAQWISVKNQLCSLMEPSQDSLRFYYLGSHWQTKIEHVGTKQSLDLNAPLVF